MKREFLLGETTLFRCSQFAPHDGPMMLDDIVVTPKLTMFYFSEDLGTVITARQLGQA